MAKTHSNQEKYIRKHSGELNVETNQPKRKPNEHKGNKNLKAKLKQYIG